MLSSYRFLRIGAQAVACLGVAFAGSTLAAPAYTNGPNTEPLPPRGSEVVEFKHAARNSPERKRPSLQPSDLSFMRRSYDEQVTMHRSPLPDEKSINPSLQTAAAIQAAAAVCDPGAFASASGAAFVSLVKSSDPDTCLGPSDPGGKSAWSFTGPITGQIFSEAKMIAIANALQSGAASYPGNNSTQMLQMVEFLRVGYWRQYGDAYDKTNYITPYGTALANAIRPALDAFVANAHFADVNNAHGAVLSEFVTLIDSARENTHHLGTVQGILNRYNASWNQSDEMKGAVTNSFIVSWNVNNRDDFRAVVQNVGPALATTFANFVNNNKAADVGTENEYMIVNAGGNLATLLQYGEPLHSTTVHPLVQKMLGDFSLGGDGTGVWVNIANNTDYNDAAHCSYFNLCNFKTTLENYALPPANNHICNASVRLRSQVALTAAQLDYICTSVGNEQPYFLNLMKAIGPVANDNNATLEMVLFNSSDDYAKYAGAIFGIDTNNGGMTLEGDPSDPANVERFIAYRAEWLPNFEIWNLTHEFVHYLDGRFNMYGAFDDYPMTSPYSSIWWIEGVAEYVSYSFRQLVDSGAVTAAKKSPTPYTLGTLFNTTYSNDQERIYGWGYLAVRYMFEQHRSDIDAMLPLFRVGNYNPGYRSWLDQRRTAFDSGFASWATCFGQNNGATTSCGGTTTPPTNTPPMANFSTVSNGLSVSFSDTSTDSDGSIAARAWTFGDGSSSTAANPSHTYAANGTYTVTLKVTDNAGAASSKTQSVTVATQPVNTPPTANFTTAITGLSVNFTDTSTDSGGSIASRAWTFGDGSSSTAADTSHTYAASGTYSVTLKVTDNGGATATKTQSVTVTQVVSGECTYSDARQLGNGCKRSGLAAATDPLYFYLYVPSPVVMKNLSFKISGGTGDADIYVKAGAWPTTSNWDYAPYLDGNNETVTIAAPKAGYYFVVLDPYAPFSGVTLQATWQ